MDDDLYGFIEAPSQEPGDTDDWDVAESDSGSGFDSDEDSGSQRRKRRRKAKKPPTRQAAKKALPDLSPLGEDSKAEGANSGDKTKGGKQDDSDGEVELVASLPPLPKRRKPSGDELPLIWVSPPSIGGAAAAAAATAAEAGGSGGGGRGGKRGRGSGSKARGRGRGRGGRGRKGASVSPAPDTPAAIDCEGSLVPVVVVESCQDVLEQSRQLSAMLDAALQEQQASQGQGESPEPLQQTRIGGRRHLALTMELSGPHSGAAGAAAGPDCRALVLSTAAAAGGDAAEMAAAAGTGPVSPSATTGVTTATTDAAGPRVQLRFRLGGDRQELRLNVPCGAPLRQAMERFAAAAAERHWAPAGAALWFEFDGDALNGAETAGGLDMEDDDIVDVGVKK